MRAPRLCHFAFSVLIFGWPAGLPAQGSRADSTAIRRLIQAHAEAWNRHDAHAAASAYASEADIRYSSGTRLQGRAAIESAHEAAFADDTAGGGSRHSHPPGSLWLRFMRPDLALAEVEARYDYPADTTGTRAAPERSLLFLVLTKKDGLWRVLAQRNLGAVR
jgi:uncharacterized protein (TIGR02246 family)